MGQERWRMGGILRMKLSSYWGFRPFKRHDLILFVAGLIYVGTGVAYILAKPNPGRFAALEVVLRIAPLSVWGILFISAGALSMLSSRWPPASEAWGYVVLTAISAGWSAAYASGIVFANSPLSNVNGALVWGLVSFLWWAVSGLRNPEPREVALSDRPD